MLQSHTIAFPSNKQDFCKAVSLWQWKGTATANDKLMVTIRMRRCRDRDTHRQLPGLNHVAMDTRSRSNKNNRSPYTILKVIIVIIWCHIILTKWWYSAAETKSWLAGFLIIFIMCGAEDWDLQINYVLTWRRVKEDIFKK